MLGSDQSSVAPFRVIQLALTPVFLLTAVAALLNVFSTRLGRVADRVDLLSADLQRGSADTEFLSAQLGFLRRRSLIPGRGRRVGNDRRCGNLRRCACIVSRRVARCWSSGTCCSVFLEARLSLTIIALVTICNRNDDGWTWAKGPVVRQHQKRLTKASPIRKLVELNEKPVRLPFHFD